MKARNVRQVLPTADFYFRRIASYFDKIEIEDGQRWRAVWACNRNICELFRFSDRVTIDDNLCNGKPTIRGKRITVNTILEFLGAGNSA